MKKTGQGILVLGGARSGKSRYALELASGFSRKTLIATLEPKDEEMAQRIASHRRARGADWRVMEEPLKLNRALRQAEKNSRVIVVDCLTLWLSNLLLAGKKESEIILELEKLCQIISRPGVAIILVSNEVGQGIVPADPLTRRFRDLQGRANQMLANVADQVYLLVAGIPVRIKGDKG